MSAGNQMIGLAVYHRTDLTEQPELIRDLLVAARAAAGEAGLAYGQGQFASSHRFSKQQKMTTENIDQLVTDIRGRVFRSVQFDELPRSRQESSAGYASLHVELHPAANPRVNSNESPAFPYRLYLLVPRGAAADTAQLERAMTAFSGTVDRGYGFVHVGRDSRDVLMELTITPMFRWGQELSASDLRRQERLQHCQLERVRIGRAICGAYWGNLLGPELVKQLGGKDQIKVEAPVALVRAIGDEAIYIQATADLPTVDDPLYQEAIGKLEAYLAPVSIASSVSLN